PNKKSFTVAANYHLRRYDDFYAPVKSDNIAVRFDYQLIDAATSEVIPLVASNAVVVKAVPSYVLGIPYKPVVLAFTDTLDLEPPKGVQLDGADLTYVGGVTIPQGESAAHPPVAGNEVETASARLLHFSGKLSFGPIATMFTSIDNTPNVGVVV